MGCPSWRTTPPRGGRGRTGSLRPSCWSGRRRGCSGDGAKTLTPEEAMRRRVELVSGVAAAAVGAAVLVAVGVGAYQHGRYGVSEGRWMLYAGTALLFVAVAIAVVSFGLLLVPAALLALIASVSASREDQSHHAA